jgi:peptidoglycan/xylan/chitin deacetylase (PgdA/CDA1 family)
VIDILIGDEPTGFGIATAFAIEGIPARRITRPAEFHGRVLVVSPDQFDAVASTLGRHVPVVIIGGAGKVQEPVARVFDEPIGLPVCGPLWSPLAQRVAREYGDGVLALPSARAAVNPSGWDGPALAMFETARGFRAPAVIERDRHVWCLVDIGRAFTDLLTESYLPAPTTRALRSRAGGSALAVHYRAADATRRAAHRGNQARLDRHLRGLGPRASAYPVDTAGWLLVSLLTGLIRRACGEVVRLGRWPAPYRSAAAITHDVEPSIYAYTAGLEQLLRRVARSGHPATFGLVAGPAARSLFVRSEAEIRRAEVLCHGLEHRGETLAGSRIEIASGIERARTLLERRFERPVRGFRSPRLDRSGDLVWALDRLGFTYDSSYPDVDRDSLDHFGGGVRLNLPFRPPLEAADGSLRPSRCLELPVSAPDCAPPVFRDDDLRQLRRAVRTKIAFVRETEGLYVGILHGGVFGASNAASRGSHLAFMARQVARPDVWLASLGDVARWWAAREHVTLRVVADRVVVVNEGQAAVAGACIEVEGDAGVATVAVPVIEAGQCVTVQLPESPSHELRIREAS